jgi:hypothetical protein
MSAPDDGGRSTSESSVYFSKTIWRNIPEALGLCPILQNCKTVFRKAGFFRHPKKGGGAENMFVPRRPPPPPPPPGGRPPGGGGGGFFKNEG